MTKPKLTFDLYEHSTGLIGFRPRVTGSPVWIDNVKITILNNFSYKGPNIPDIKYFPDSLITNWEAIGPFDKPQVEIEKSENKSKEFGDAGIDM